MKEGRGGGRRERGEREDNREGEEQGRRKEGGDGSYLVGQKVDFGLILLTAA